jgi:hypothetical protein
MLKTFTQAELAAMSLNWSEWLSELATERRTTGGLDADKALSILHCALSALGGSGACLSVCLLACRWPFVVGAESRTATTPARPPHAGGRRLSTGNEALDGLFTLVLEVELLELFTVLTPGAACLLTKILGDKRPQACNLSGPTERACDEAVQLARAAGTVDVPELANLLDIVATERGKGGA